MNLIEVTGKRKTEGGKPLHILINMNHVRAIEELEDGTALIWITGLKSIQTAEKYQTVLKALRGFPWDK